MIPPFGVPPLPAQSGNSGKYLKTDGSKASWEAVSGGGGVDIGDAIGNSPETNGILYVDSSGNLQNSSDFTWDNSANTLLTKLDASQSANIFEVRDSSSNLLSGVDERGVMFSTLNQTSSTIFGNNAGNDSATGSGNSLFGNDAGNKLTSGSQNALYGFQAANSLTSGSFNFALGSQSLKSVTVGNHNIAIGNEAMKITSATITNTVSIGQQAGYQLAGTYNASVLIGDYAGRGSTGSRLAGVGANVLYAADRYSVGLGFYAGYNSGEAGVYVGYRAGENESGDNKLYIANSNTTTPLIYGDFSTAALTVNGSLKVTGNLGLFNTTPVAQDTGWSATNVSTDRTFDASSTTLNELANVVGTLVNQLKTYGLLGA